MDKLVKAINSTNEFSIATCVTTNMVKEAVEKQKLVTGFSNAFSDVISANVLMSATMKDQREELSLHLKTDGMLVEITSTGDYDGNFSGFGMLNSKSAKRIIGDGVLEVVKYFDNKEVRSSKITIDSNRVSDVIVDYFFQSDQVYSVVLLASLCDKKTNEFYASGGILIQMLPNSSQEIRDNIMNVISNIKDLSKKIALGMSALELVNLIDKEAKILQEKPIFYKCKCSKEKTLESLKRIDIEEIKTIIKEDGELRVVCNGCNKSYQFTIEDFVVS